MEDHDLVLSKSCLPCNTLIGLTTVTSIVTSLFALNKSFIRANCMQHCDTFDFVCGQH